MHPDYKFPAFQCILVTSSLRFNASWLQPPPLFLQAERWGAEMFTEDVESIDLDSRPFTVTTAERQVGRGGGHK